MLYYNILQYFIVIYYIGMIIKCCLLFLQDNSMYITI